MSGDVEVLRRWRFWHNFHHIFQRKGGWGVYLLSADCGYNSLRCPSVTDCNLQWCNVIRPKQPFPGLGHIPRELGFF